MESLLLMLQGPAHYLIQIFFYYFMQDISFAQPLLHSQSTT